MAVPRNFSTSLHIRVALSYNLHGHVAQLTHQLNHAARLHIFSCVSKAVLRNCSTSSCVSMAVAQLQHLSSCVSIAMSRNFSICPRVSAWLCHATPAFVL
eukprot:scaffold36912_cov18-Tisochrysis_lutea.AAC.1